MSEQEVTIDSLVQQIMSHNTPTSEIPFEPKCNICGDDGYIIRTNEDGQHYTEKCACKIAAESENRIRYSGLAHVLIHGHLTHLW